MTTGHCDTCGYLLDVAHNALCAELIGARYQLKQQLAETSRLAREIRVLRSENGARGEAP